MCSYQDLKKQAIRGVAWTMVEKYAGEMVQFIVYIILARILTPSEYGLIGMLAIFMGLSAVFIDGGFSSALIQCKDKSPIDYSTVFYINTGMALCIYTTLFICGPLIAEFYSQPILNDVIRVYGLTLIISSLVSTSKTKLVVELDFKTTTKISLTSAILSGFIGICCAYYGLGVWALVTQSISSGVISIIITYYYVRWIPKDGFSKKSFKKLFSFSSRLFAASIISSIYENITGAVIGKQFNATTLGYYTRAYGFNSLVNNSITGVLGRVSYPLLSKIQTDDAQLKSIYQRYIQMSAFLSFPVILMLFGIAKPFILFLLTDKWSESIILLQILSLGFLCDGIIVSNLNLIKVKGRSDLVLKLEIVKKVIAFSILAISIVYQSVLAICIGKALYSYIALYLNTYYTKKILGYGFLEQIKDYWMYFIASAIIATVALIISTYVTIPLLSLVLSIPICISLYLLICSRLKLYAYIQFVDIAKPIISKVFRFLNR